MRDRFRSPLGGYESFAPPEYKSKSEYDSKSKSEHDSKSESESKSKSKSKSQSESEYESKSKASDPEPFDGGGEHRALLDAVHGTGAFAGGGNPDAPDPYQHLMSREKRVLETVDRVVNDARRAELASGEDFRTFTQLPLHVIGMRALSSLRALLDDLVMARTPQAVYAALMQDDRKIYLGVCAILLAFCLTFIQAST